MPEPDPPVAPCFVVLYRWRLHPGMEDAFVEAWSRVSEMLRSECGSSGSRLHRGSDGLWYSYAQWPSAQARRDAFALGPVDAEAGRVMDEAIAERFAELVLEPVATISARWRKTASASVDAMPSAPSRRGSRLTTG